MNSTYKNVVESGQALPAAKCERAFSQWEAEEPRLAQRVVEGAECSIKPSRGVLIEKMSVEIACMKSKAEVENVNGHHEELNE